MRKIFYSIFAFLVAIGISPIVSAAYQYPETPSSLRSTNKAQTFRNFTGGTKVSREDIISAVRSAPVKESKNGATSFMRQHADLVANLVLNQECTSGMTLCGWGLPSTKVRPKFWTGKTYVGLYQQSSYYAKLAAEGVGGSGVTAKELDEHFKGNLQAQTTVWMKMRIHDGAGLHTNKNHAGRILERFKKGDKTFNSGPYKFPLDAAGVIACVQIGPGICQKGLRDGNGLTAGQFACHTRGGKVMIGNKRANTRADFLRSDWHCSVGPGETYEVPAAEGYTGCLNGAPLPAQEFFDTTANGTDASSEFVGPPSPGTESTPDFKAPQTQLVLNTSMAGSAFENACKQQIEQDLQGLGVEKLPRMPYNDNEHFVISRYGSIRIDGKTRAHAGIDLATSEIAGKRKQAQLVAADDGYILTSMYHRNGARLKYNPLEIQRAKFPNHVIRYLHMKDHDVSLKGKKFIKAGDPVGIEGKWSSGRDGGKGGTGCHVHLHFEYYVPPGDRKKFGTTRGVNIESHGGIARFPNIIANGTLTGAPLKKVVATDPAPFLPQPISMGRPSDGGTENAQAHGRGRSADYRRNMAEIFGDNTYSQYCIVRGIKGDSIGSFSEDIAADTYATNGMACDPQNSGQLFPNNDGWNEIDTWLDMSPDGVYDYRSFLERALWVAQERFNNPMWSKSLISKSSHALWRDYLAARRSAIWLDWQLHQKRERINNMLAVLTATKADAYAGSAALARATADLQAAQ